VQVAWTVLVFVLPSTSAHFSDDVRCVSPLLSPSLTFSVALL
jgi:hypothetical protein